jgi:hypothetical protein
LGVLFGVRSGRAAAIGIGPSIQTGRLDGQASAAPPLIDSPGWDGVENPEQCVSYRKLFITARRLETLSWQRSDAELADIVYAAWTAGVRMPLTEFT